MTTHLSPEEFVDALDDVIAMRVQAHLAACDACRGKLDAARDALQEARAVEIPEPSPLFWDHFSARVAQATQEQAIDAAESRQTFWQMLWRPGVMAPGAVVAVIMMLVMVMRPGPGPRTGSNASSDLLGVTPVVRPMPDEDGTWGLVEGLAAGLDWSEVHQAAEPAVGTADAMIEELTPAQRDALVRLLQREMGDL